MMVTQSPGRIFLVSLAAMMGWRLAPDGWPLAALAVVAAGWLAQTWLLERFQEAGGGAAHPALLTDLPSPRDLRCHEAGRNYPLLTESLAMVAWAIHAWRPDLVPPQIGLSVLALCHGAAFRVVCALAWPEAAVAVGRSWRWAVSPAALARLVRARTVVLPKRGVLTLGRPRIDRVEVFGAEARAEDVLRLAAALLRGESSALGRALQQAARRARLALPNVADYEVLPGLGRVGRIDDRRYYLGGAGLAAHLGQALPELAAEALPRQVEGGTVLLLFQEQTPLGMLAVEDPLRDDALRLVDHLRAAGVARVAVLTDDDPEAAEETRRRFQLDEVVPQVAEEQEAEVIRRWSADGPVVVAARPAVNGGALAAANTAVPLLRPDEPVPDYAALAIRNDDPLRLPVAWSAARTAMARDGRLARTITCGNLVPLMAACAGAPLPLVVALDELVILGTLAGYVRRAARD